MSRAMRRQQMVKKPPTQAPAFKPSGPRPQKKPDTSAAAVEAKRNRTAYDKYVPGFARDIISELRKVSWPTREETTRLGFAVIVVSVAIGLALGGIDLGFNWLVDNTLLRD
jgi:preprotein translocase SecE subunit